MVCFSPNTWVSPVIARSTGPCDRRTEETVSVEHNTRDCDPDIVTDFRERMSYGGYLRYDALAPALTRIARVKQIQRTLTEQWSVPATLTPTEYAHRIRPVSRVPRQLQRVPVLPAPRGRVRAGQ